ncbi:protein FAR1-RELATED SEQUENCE 8-like [Arachis stenosperma]|uniref:protein FAR1-RELATED SEQUENCE 8-like n=1 Tax=Arachis stenosperma TaxID=217475 RepID=UPI0025AC54AE|nr:protein FAR1-RELATED SEQUENCE 8-like [Arachis stenosperma]
MKELNPNFFFEIDVDENYSIRNVFWIDARCRAAWEYFGDVVTFNTTYKTNRYDMSFGSFVGVNHHGMSTLLGYMFADRHMWVPVFFKDEFWAGMKSTQCSESMHSVFNKYLNSKSSLLQFVCQYQNCVIDKEQKEIECDAADLRGIIPCVSSSPIEKQFQREYTNSMFRDVQDQFIKKADCDISSVNHHGTSIVYEVDQQKMVFDILAVLLHFRMKVVSSQYILSRWSKNDFVATPVVAAILRDAMDNARQKLKEHKESEHQAAHGSNGNAQPSPTNVASSYKDTQWACSEMTDNLAMHSGSFISLLNSFHNAEQLCMCT